MKKFVKFSKLKTLTKVELKNAKGGVSCELINGVPLYGVVALYGINPLYGIEIMCDNEIK